MALSPVAVVGLAGDLIERHLRSLRPDEHHGLIRRYLEGDHDLPYIPKGAKTEYKTLAQRSITNWLPLISDTFSKALFVDGYRAGTAAENAAPWSYWQANGLDARQTVAHRGALEYGASYVLVLPGSPAPLMRPLKPTRVIAWYEDDDDEWPVYGIIRKGTRADGAALYLLVDKDAVYTVARKKLEGGETRLFFVKEERHGLGVCPLVRFRDQFGGDNDGIIKPLITVQDRINESIFSLLIAIQYASFRQRWATGLAVPTDDEGNPVEPFAAAVDRLWVTDNHEAKFGDFAQTETSGHLRSYESAVKTLAAIAQTSPHVLTGDMANLSADALAVIESSTTRKAGEYETLFGESWEQAFRLAALADGDTANATDTSAEVRWRDSEARSLSQTVDALGKMTQMLMVPAEALWERIPGVTQTDVERWKEMANSADGLRALSDILGAQASDSFAPTIAPATEV